MAASLQEQSTEAVITNLGKVAKGIECLFSCGGSVDANNILISYKTKAGNWSSQPLQLPGSTDIQDLLDTCSIAGFGIGDQTVIDKNYRDALKLEPDSFTTNFNISNTCIINDITNVLSITSPIQAELYKLNIYSIGGHFKSHVDTPRSKDMFGSLVVCLPSPFTGGELVTSHQGRRVMFDWSNSSNIQWAAFYSDVKHEVLPVTSGYRITFTYNLYHQPNHIPFQLPTSIDIKSNPFYCELLAALRNPHFMRQGGILGFYCQHKYVDIDKKYPVLKGEDAVVYQTAKSLQLAVDVKPVCHEEHYEGKYMCVTYNYLNNFYYTERFVLRSFQSFANRWYYREDEDTLDRATGLFGDVVSDDTVTWCQKAKDNQWDASGSTVHYGNEAISTVFYQVASILIVIPKYTTKRLSAGTDTIDLFDCSVNNALEFP